MSDIFDFGFTAVTEEELEAVQDAVQSQASIGENLEVLQEKVDKLYNSMIPLLSNLINKTHQLTLEFQSLLLFVLTHLFFLFQ